MARSTLDTPAPPALTVSGLTIRYGERTALAGVDVAVGQGEVVAVVGPNGAGKSSLFKAIVGLVAHEGGVTLHGRPCHHRRHRLEAAYLPQRADIDLGFPVTVGDVVLMGRRRFVRRGRRPGAHDRAAVAGALRRVRLAGFEGRPIGAVSGGELQRVLLARALTQEADVLLLDEALSGVDQPATAAMLELLDELAADGAAVLVSTHDLALARRRFARCLALNGRVVADGDPHVCLDGPNLEATFGSGAVVVAPPAEEIAAGVR
jgi:ABC-type Mn2+/Zn2+ transport system ATPase subunit